MSKLEEIAVAGDAASDQRLTEACTLLQNLPPLLQAASADDKRRVREGVERIKVWAEQGPPEPATVVHQVGMTVIGNAPTPTKQVIIAIVNKVLEGLTASNRSETRGCFKRSVLPRVQSALSPIGMVILKQGIHQAAAYGNHWVLSQLSPAAVRELLATTNKAGETTLHIAAKNGQLSFLQVAREKLGDPQEFLRLLNHQSIDNATAMDSAMAPLVGQSRPGNPQPHLNVVTYLAGLMPATNQEVAHSLCVVRTFGNRELFDCLATAYAARTRAPDARGLTPLDYALKFDFEGALQFLRSFSQAELAAFSVEKREKLRRLAKENPRTEIYEAMLSHPNLVREIPEAFNHRRFIDFLVNLPGQQRRTLIQAVGSAPPSGGQSLNKGYTLLHCVIARGQPQLLDDFSKEQIREICRRVPSPLVLAAKKDIAVLRNLIARLKLSGVSEAEMRDMLKVPDEEGDTLLHHPSKLIMSVLALHDPHLIPELLQMRNQLGHTPLARALGEDRPVETSLLLGNAKQNEGSSPTVEAILDQFVQDVHGPEDLLRKIHIGFPGMLRGIANRPDLGGAVMCRLITELVTSPERLEAGVRQYPDLLFDLFSANNCLVQLGAKGVMAALRTLTLMVAKGETEPSPENAQLAHQARRMLQAMSPHSPLVQTAFECFDLLPKEARAEDRCLFAQMLASEMSRAGAQSADYKRQMQSQLPKIAPELLASVEQRAALIDALRKSTDQQVIDALVREAKELLTVDQMEQFLRLVPVDGKLRCATPEFESLKKGLYILRQTYEKAALNREENIYQNIVQYLSFSDASGFEGASTDLKDLYLYRHLIERPLPEGLKLPKTLFAPSKQLLEIIRSSNQWQALSAARAGVSLTAEAEGDVVVRDQWLTGERQVATWAAASEPLTPERIAEIHRLVCENQENNGYPAGVYRTEGVDISTLSGGDYVKGKYVEQEVRVFTSWLAEALTECDRNPNSLPLIIMTAAKAYQWLVSIHPFADGNGRTTRLVMDYILQRYGVLPPKLKDVAVAVFAELPPEGNVAAEHAFLLVWEGVNESYRALLRC